jgi:hypothetical protein
MVIISPFKERIKQSVAASPDEKPNLLHHFQYLPALPLKLFLWDLLNDCSHNHQQVFQDLFEQMLTFENRGITAPVVGSCCCPP